MRTLYDAVASKSTNIPADAQMVAGYVVGPYAWTAADWARFPNAVQVTITTTAAEDADVLDVETGAANPDSAPPWCSIQRKHGGTPSVYCNLSTWPAAKAAFAAAGVTEPNWWIAAYDNVAEIPDGAVAKQYTDNAPSNPYDTSIVADYWPGVDPLPQPSEEDMKPVVIGVEGQGVFLFVPAQNPYKLYLPDVATAQAMIAAYGPQQTVSVAFAGEMPTVGMEGVPVPQNPAPPTA